MDLAMIWRVRMMALASEMSSHRTGAVPMPEYADLVGSMCDLRAAVNIAQGVPVEHITSQGYPDMAYLRHRARRREAQRGDQPVC
ncbi:hypothetical protein ABT324_00655 [Saccharopolyspora sp. NPDC000359]|uniref:hypothetical protein n=1 Tax=Saccharopolyspora sp. NPDC000359 TaxID=3154251 RepID=UPI00332EC1A5